jgi:release factor glutamine methyltransferase
LIDLGRAMAEVAGRLADSGIADARREARLLAAAATGLSQAALIADPSRALAAVDAERLDRFARRRTAREPLSRILGRREFWSLSFALGPETLDPRPDSETLIEAALAWVGQRQNHPWRVLDLGTGTGCLLLALLSELPAAEGLGIDISPAAVAVADGNAAALCLARRARFGAGDWGAGIKDRFDILLCNPPYIPAAEIAGLAPEVARYDPPRALAGGADGLEAYRRLARDLPALLAPGARAFIELGAGQLLAVQALFQGAGLRVMGHRRDLADIPRCLDLAP